MPIRRATLVLAMLGIVPAGCAQTPAQPRGMFDLSNMPANVPSSASATAIPDHTRQGGGGSFSTGIGGGINQMPGSPTGGL